MKSGLTLNLGLRWEHETPTTERYGRTANEFDPTAVNPVSGGKHQNSTMVFTFNGMSNADIDQFQYYDGSWKDINLTGNPPSGSSGPNARTFPGSK